MILWKQNVRTRLDKRLKVKDLAPRARFELATLRLTAERDKNLGAASGVAYIRLGTILTFLAARNLAPKSIRWADHSGCHAGAQWDVSIA